VHASVRRPALRKKSSSSSGVRNPLQSRSDKRANENMSAGDLNRIARSLGIPFGGLNKQALVRKINRYLL
jgi:hypothetical protein